MYRKLVFMLTLTLLIGVLSVASSIQRAKASGTIYIRADGSIDPPTAPIMTADNTTYTFTGNVNESISMLAIVVERNSIVVDGQGYTVQGTGSGTGTGITFSERSNVTIKNMTIKAFGIGIYVCNSSNYNIFSGNNITANSDGIVVVYSSGNSISGNSVTANKWNGIDVGNSSSYNSISGNNITANNEYGISISFSSNNSMNGNNITSNREGIRLYYSCSNNSVSGNNVVNNGNGITFYYSSSNNTICHNNFINNTNQVYSSNSTNVWDNGFEGNYWNDYNGTDNNQDGIEDTPYVIDENNTDNHPLMGMFSEFDWVSLAAPEQRIQTICNSTISNLIYNGTAISFNVTGQDGTAGFCRIRIPAILLNVTYEVFVNGTEVTNRLLPFSNETYRYLYFNYTHSTQEVIIIPEFSSFLTVALFTIGTVLAVAVCKKKHSENLVSDKCHFFA